MKEILYLAQQTASPPATGGAKAPTSSSPFGQWGFLIMIGVFILMYLLLILPQKREEKRKKAMLSALRKGDSVVTTSGILGTVASVKEDSVFLNIGDGTRVEFLRSSISQLRKPSSSADNKSK